MKTLYSLAFLAQIVLVFCQRDYGYYRYEYHVPRPSIQSWDFRGFRISIPHRPGIEKVTFHVSLKGPIASPNVGEYTQEVLDRDRWNGRWAFIERTANVQGGDMIYFWIEVVKDGQTYTYDNGRYIVTEKFFTSSESDESISSEEYRYWREKGFGLPNPKGLYS